MKKKKSRMLVVYTLVVIVLFGGIFALNQAGNNGNAEERRLAEAPAIEGQPIAGDPNAGVSIVEFGDYKCPSCKIWEEQIKPQLQQDYLDTGVASFAYVNTMFHGEESILAGQASEVILMNHPEQFWDFHKALFAEQPAQVNHDELWVTQDKVLEVAEATVPDLDAQQFQTDLRANEVVDKLMKDQELVDTYDIQQTPTIVVNDRVIANPFDMDEIRQVIEQELE
ncbi:thioredoxin domain-containing protein [Paenibacillus daejeonensis]|uniref:thioredoxin domain-containing protein n=1 Tax=Paenibacillus daejeonensis TaxID=135193 RepID=UPI000382074D|nr:thioredoxin domain-containing protein [Paenibacillus daejeonensis]